MAVVVLGVMLGLPPIATVWLLTVLVLVGAWEWAAFLGKGSVASRAAFTIVIALMLVACLYCRLGSSGFVRMAMIVALAWWFVAFLWLCLAPARVTPVTAALAGLLSLVPCWLALVHVTFTTQSARWVLFTLGARVGRRHRRVLRRPVVRPRAAGAARVAEEDLGRRPRRRADERRRRLDLRHLAVHCRRVAVRGRPASRSPRSPSSAISRRAC